MELWVGNLPIGTHPAELHHLLRQTLFPPLANHCRTAFFQYRDRNGHPLVFVTLRTPNRWLAHWAMRRLDGRALSGRPLVVHEFHRRSAGRERRALNWRVRAWDGPERRHRERRDYRRVTRLEFEANPLLLRLGV